MIDPELFIPFIPPIIGGIMAYFYDTSYLVDFVSTSTGRIITGASLTTFGSFITYIGICLFEDWRFKRRYSN